MKKFLKKGFIYIGLLIIVAGIIFGLNNYYGTKISADLEQEFNQLAQNNKYQLELSGLKANPLLRKIKIENLDLKKRRFYNLNISEAEIHLSWQQIINYLVEQEFRLDKNFESQIKEIDYSSLVNNYQLNFKEAELYYQGDLTKADFKQLSTADDLYFLLENDHELNLKAAGVKYDFPFYRYLGFNDQNWDKISSFDNFEMEANYNQKKQLLKVNKFNLSGDILKIGLDFDSKVKYNNNKPKIKIEEFKSNYDLLITADDLVLEPNSIFRELEFNKFALNGNVDLTTTQSFFNLNEFDFDLNLKEFKILLSEKMSRSLYKNSFGVLSPITNVKFKIDDYSYQQEYTAPNGNFQSNIDSSLLNAQLKGEYNYDQEDIYINDAILKYKVKSEEMENLNYLIQLVLAKNLTKNEEGYYTLEFWGDTDDLNFK